MTPVDARSAVVTALRQIAPEIEPQSLEDSDRLRQDLDLDSLDFLRLIEQIAATTGIDIPERDYPEVATVGGLVGYLAAHRQPEG
ncbi:phosphopantetheine-binding protein [Sinomonas atrocyanea]|uniref:phosphopantetheine-binding protein n=1 Tax=Sinomonas atrocyanea TaxID=37927 RepID=UPI00277EE25A|nr:phosphopantetheine-binding protein [Sinomonas atrocyanea]MDQ0261493.1 acyl carrier protein [Sinomonas atrocyanea]MDR6622791.1 acyl carrier protein [Sinomonas atrocyanea]